MHAHNLIVGAKRLTTALHALIWFFGNMEETNVPKALAMARRDGVKFDIMTPSFFLNRRSFRSDPKRGLPRWKEKLFVSLTRSAADATTFYRLPTDRVIELGQQLTI